MSFERSGVSSVPSVIIGRVFDLAQRERSLGLLYTSRKFSQGGAHMKSIRCFAATLVLVGLLAGCLCLGGANTVAYAASPGATIATGTPSFCQVLPNFITKVEALKPGFAIGSLPRRCGSTANIAAVAEFDRHISPRKKVTLRLDSLDCPGRPAVPFVSVVVTQIHRSLDRDRPGRSAAVFMTWQVNSLGPTNLPKINAQTGSG